MNRTLTGPDHYDLLIAFCQYLREGVGLDSETFDYDTDDAIVEKFLEETYDD